MAFITMNLIDIIIGLLILAYCGWVLYNHFHPKDGCSHVCSTCSSSTCHLNDVVKDLKEAKEKEFHH